MVLCVFRLNVLPLFTNSSLVFVDAVVGSGVLGVGWPGGPGGGRGGFPIGMGTPFSSRKAVITAANR